MNHSKTTLAIVAIVAALALTGVAFGPIVRLIVNEYSQVNNLLDSQN